MARDALWLANRLFEIAVGDDTYEDVLLALGKAIKQSWDAATADSDEGWLAYECMKVEMLLGAALVVCQAKMTSVLEAWAYVQLHKTGNRPNSKSALNYGPTLNGYSKAALVWAIANYFKHHDEWDRSEWQNPFGRSARTIPLIQAIGLHEDNEGNNLRLAAEHLGAGDGYDVMAFSKIIDDWVKALP
jgi:hypothetical protein